MLRVNESTDLEKQPLIEQYDCLLEPSCTPDLVKAASQQMNQNGFFDLRNQKKRQTIQLNQQHSEGFLNRDKEKKKSLTSFSDIMSSHLVKQLLPSAIKEEEQEEEEKYVACPICYTYVIDRDLVEMTCGHQYCKICLSGYFEYCVTKEGEATKVKCPTVSCLVSFTEDQLKTLMSEEVLIKYLSLLQGREVITSKTKIYCPIAVCSQVIEAAEKTKNVMCLNCNHQVCFSCQLEWHEGVSCENVQIEAERKWALGSNANICPKCKTPVEKNEGCKHMTCYVCKYQWCWGCGGKWKYGMHKYEDLFVVKCCGNPPSRKLCSAYNILFLILTLFLIPLGLFFILAVLVIGGLCSEFSRCIRRSCKCPMSFICLPCILGFYLLILAIGVGFGAIGYAVLLIPVLVLSVLACCRPYKYWSANRKMRQKK